MMIPTEHFVSLINEDAPAISGLSLIAEFAESSRVVSVSEPEDSDTASVSLVVERIGGDTGVIEVSWSLSSSNGRCGLAFELSVMNSSLGICVGDDPSLDIVPVSGTLQFISNVRQQEIDLLVKADDIPEVEEVFQ